MLPLHASILFNGPVELVRALIGAYPRACALRDDQGALPLHVAFRAGSPEGVVLALLGCHPEAIEGADGGGRLPSDLSPRDAVAYGDAIGEAFLRGPSHYYWSARVAAADRARGEAKTQARIRGIEERAAASAERYKALLESTGRHCAEEVRSLSDENDALKRRIAHFESKYDGADEKERVLVEHTNSLAERLRLTTMSEERLATEVARLEARLRDGDEALGQTRETATEENQAFEELVSHLSTKIDQAESEARTLKRDLENKARETNEIKAQFERERQISEKQLGVMKECLAELIAGSKEDRRMFDEESKELRRQLASFQSEVQMASLEEKRMFAADSQELRRQLAAIQSEMERNAKAAASNNNVTSPAHAVLPKALNSRLEHLQNQLENNAASFMNRVNILEAKDDEKLRIAVERQSSTAKKIEDRLDGLQREMEHAKIGGKFLLPRDDDESANRDNRAEPNVERGGAARKDGPSKESAQIEPGGMHGGGGHARAELNTERVGALLHKNSPARESVAVGPTKMHGGGGHLLQAEPKMERNSAHKHNSPGVSAAVEPKKAHCGRVEAHAEPNAELGSAHNKHNSPGARAAIEPKKTPSRGVHARHNQEREAMAMAMEADALIDTYVSTKSSASNAGAESTTKSVPRRATREHETRDDYEAMDTSYSLRGNEDGALGTLTVEQAMMLESLDLSGDRDQIAEMLGRVPGLTKNQVNLLVDVASSLAA
jgi:hypothetical protein